MGNAQFGNLKTIDAWWGTSSPPHDPYAKMYPRPPEITYDPLEGFPKGRKKRVPTATMEEMISAKVEAKYRDYCAGKLIAFKTCAYLKYPMLSNCAHERHVWEDCQYQDYLLRLKEAEREKRLRRRDGKPAPA